MWILKKMLVYIILLPWHYDYMLLWSEMLVAQSCPSLCDPMDCSPIGSSAHGILQTRILEWVPISFSRGYSQPRDWTQVSRIVDRLFTIWVKLGNPYIKCIVLNMPQCILVYPSNKINCKWWNLTNRIVILKAINMLVESHTQCNIMLKMHKWQNVFHKNGNTEYSYHLLLQSGNITFGNVGKTWMVVRLLEEIKFKMLMLAFIRVF